MLARLLYFLLFNTICAISITYVINDDKERVKKSEEMRLNQKELTKVIESIYEEVEGKKLTYGTELQKREYIHCKNKALKEMSDTVQGIMEGRSKEEIAKQGKSWKAKIAQVLVPVVMAGLGLRYLYTQYKK